MIEIKNEETTMLEHLIKLIDEFNTLKNDKDRFRFIIQHKGIFKLSLDNDQTWPAVADHIAAQFSEDVVEDLPTMNDFDGYLGWSDGVVSLLEVIGVKGEPV